MTSIDAASLSERAHTRVTRTRAHARKGTIEVKAAEVSALFEQLDPFPYRERDLHKDIEEFIVGWAQELDRSVPIQLTLHVHKLPETDDVARDISAAICSHFSYRAEITGLELRNLFRVGLRFLVIGLSILAACVLVARVMLPQGKTTPLDEFFQLSLVILGWVANEKPITLFLYDWWPIAAKRKLYLRLAKAKIELVKI